MTEFAFRMPPFRHQLEEWEVSRNLNSRAIFWEAGTGKSKLTIDTAAWQYQTGKIDAVLILAPNGVHENWVTDELPRHMPTCVDYTAHCYHSGKSSTQWHQRACERLLRAEGLAILCMSYEAFMTKRNKKWMGGLLYARKFLDKRKVLYVLDESQKVKTPSAKRTRSITASGKYAVSRRILSGTPVTKNPFDIYTQLRFLDKDFWVQHGFASYQAFSTHFGIWESFEQTDGDGRVVNRFNKVVAFKHLDDLNRIVAAAGSRLTKEDVLDLPPKLYTKRYYDLTPEQARMYQELKTMLLTQVESGEIITAPLVITQLLRLQQLICGYLPDDVEEGRMHRMDSNPRLALLKETLNDEVIDGKAIIWARFKEDINQIMDMLGDQAVRYDGSVTSEDRLTARQRFQDPNDPVRFFVANPAAAATGLTLTQARTVLYYSNSFDLEHRLQSEDRAHRIGQTHPVLYIDIAAKGTVDTKIISTLRNKQSIAQRVMGDELRDWI